MPSITEVDNIKSLDDSGQTYILTKTGTGGSKVFTLDNVTLGSGVVGGGFSSNVSFMAYSAASWVDLADGDEALFPLERYDNGSNYNTSTSRFTAPADGLYYFGAYIHTSDDDDSNSFGFLKDDAVNTSFIGSNSQDYGNTHSNDSSQHKQAFSAMFYLTSGDEVSVGSFQPSDYYGINSWWMGCRVF